MGSPFLTGLLLIGLFVIAFSLVTWLTRHYRDKGSILDPKAAAWWPRCRSPSSLSACLPRHCRTPDKLWGPGDKELPPHIFAILPAAAFFCTALLAAIGLMLGAAFQLVSSWFRPAHDALRRSAARLAIYGVGASIVAFAHITLLRLGPGLLK